MKAISIIILAMLLIVPVMSSVQAEVGVLTVEKIDTLLYKFTYVTEGNVTEYRWSFGDGASSVAESPAHQYAFPQNYTVRCDVTFSDGSTDSQRIIVDGRLPVSVEGDVLTIGEISVVGGFMLVSALIMFLFLQSGNHPLGEMLGSRGKGLLSLLYFTLMTVGAVLVFNSIYGGI